ncbi:MAG: DegT/DnrJ/EryC1/StrS family aminotransferase [Cyanobacteria bacterium]|nr:DegT/DnrJ/EryC1/StrS family aminotransferase [Cyanobacteriota bacterium]
MTAYLHQMEPLITPADMQAVAVYLQSGGWLTEFRETRTFEAMLGEYTGARYCVAAPSGTLALFLALKGMGIGPGDEVLVPDLTMAASATAVLLTGASVAFVDIEPGTLCLDLAACERRITGRTKAVMAVSLNGRAPADLPAFISRCRAAGVRVIEDAAQALGSFAEGRHLGTLGDAGCLSFSSQKIVTTGQGGAVLTNDESLHHTMRLLRDFGRVSGGNDRYQTVGWNLKFTDLQAVIGTSQMQRLPRIVARKRAIFARYRAQLAEVAGAELVETNLDTTTPWFVDVLVDAAVRAALIAHLHGHGLGSRPFYPPLHAAPAFARAERHPVAEQVSARGLWLPSSLHLSDADIDRVCDALRAFMRAR